MHVDLWDWLHILLWFEHKLSIEVLIKLLGWLNVIWGDFWDGDVKEGARVVQLPACCNSACGHIELNRLV